MRDLSPITRVRYLVNCGYRVSAKVVSMLQHDSFAVLHGKVKILEIYPPAGYAREKILVILSRFEDITVRYSLKLDAY